MSQGKTGISFQEYADSIINTAREPLIVLDQDLRVVSASRSFYEVFKVNSEETVPCELLPTCSISPGPGFRRPNR